MYLDNYKKIIESSVTNYLEGFLLSLEDLLNTFVPDVGKMFDKDTLYRSALNDFVISVRDIYTSFISTELEFSSSKEEVDQSLVIFQNKIKDAIVNFEKNILSIIRTEGYQTNIIMNYASCVGVKVINDDIPRKQNELEKLRYVIALIYLEYEAIKDKNDKMNAYKKYVSGADDNKQIIANYTALLNERDYDKFLQLYSDKAKNR